MLKLSSTLVILIIVRTLVAAPAPDADPVSPDENATYERTSCSRDYYKFTARANKTMYKSVLALDDIMVDPINTLPNSLISDMEGIIIFPDAFKLAFGVAGGQGGRGVALIRQDDGSWSNPYFVNLGEGSVGFQFGVESSHIFLLFRDKEDIIGIEKAEITLGSDLSIAAGQMSNESLVTSDLKFESEVYSYKYSKGLFAGLSLKGGVISGNDRVNDAVYGIEDVASHEVFYRIDQTDSFEIAELKRILELYTE